MKRVFIVHGWDFNPEVNWYPWLKKELEKKGFKVIVPEMPNTSEPKINAWVSYLKKVVGKLDEETYFIGHSIGCQTIMRYLQEINVKIGGVLFVAGWLTLKELETQEEKDVAEQWLSTSIDFDKLKRILNKVTALFSLDDPYVPISDANIFKEKLGAKTITEKNKGHFNDEKYDIILAEFLKLIE